MTDLKVTGIKTNIKSSVFILLLIAFCPVIYGQAKVPTKELKVQDKNGYEVFHICVTNPKIVYDDTKEYFWYNEFSKVKSTKGGSGGDLLHGNYKHYNESGNLVEEKNYYIGLEDGNEKKWDSVGNIISQTTFDKGEVKYRKFKNNKKQWVEYIGGLPYKEGAVTKVYSANNALIREETTLPKNRRLVKTFNENTGKLESEFTSDISGEFIKGKYIAYHENGKPRMEGLYYDSEADLNLKTGIWNYYYLSGTLETTVEYKTEVLFWTNGKVKMAGDNVLNKENNLWVKDGEWKWYDEEGRLMLNKKYKLGVEISQ